MNPLNIPTFSRYQSKDTGVNQDKCTKSYTIVIHLAQTIIILLQFVCDHPFSNFHRKTVTCTAEMRKGLKRVILHRVLSVLQCYKSFS